MQGQRLGELLRGRRLVTDRELADALALQSLAGGLLGQLLIRLGAISEADLMAVLGDELGLTTLSADEAPKSAQVAALLAEIRSPAAWWTQRQAMAWRAGEGDDARLYCAAVNPLDPALADRLSQLGWPVELRLARQAQVAAVLDEIAHGARVDAEAAQPAGTQRLKEMAQETPVIDFVNAIFAEAVTRRASDIHIEPFADHFAVRMRIDGMLHDDPHGRRAPASTPSAHGSSCCRAWTSVSGGCRRMGASRSASPARSSTCASPACPRSGASRWCCACWVASDRLPQLAELGVSDAQICSAARPGRQAERRRPDQRADRLGQDHDDLPAADPPQQRGAQDRHRRGPGGVRAARRGADAGAQRHRPFLRGGLRSILRQDPDVIMIGEIRDQETAHIAVQAALTGHLVISTIHTNSALAAVPRLLDLKVEPFLLADVVRGLVGQRLVRRLCPHCAAPSDHDRAAIYEAARPAGFRCAGTPVWKEPVGCAKCGQSGYLGRLGLYEIAPSSPALEHEIRHRASEEALLRTARAEGFASLAEDGYVKARAGLTTLAELRRVAGGAGDPPLATPLAAQ